jgi:MoaE-MoaD fusion protein
VTTAQDAGQRRGRPEAPSHLEVRLFGGLVDHAGRATVTIEYHPGLTVGSIRDAVATAAPGLAPFLGRVVVAVNRETAVDVKPIGAHDEVAFLPPVAGGATAVLTGVHEVLPPVETVLEALAAPEAGAHVVFLGTVRNHSAVNEVVTRLGYTAYETMASEVLQGIADEVVGRWPAIRGVALLHALGDLPVGAPTVLVACSAPHREEAYEASRYALEELKQRAPVWKREMSGSKASWIGLEPQEPPVTGSTSSPRP